MRILHEEIQLREETRAAEQARPALEPEEFAERSLMLAEVQGELATRVAAVAEKILELPDAEQVFGRELAILMRVEEVMSEAQQLLEQPETGPETIAAETEAIELLLQSRRINPGGGGGGGASPGGGGTGDTDESALALLGRGAEDKARYQAQTVRQGTGSSGAELPAEFRHGLDSFFDALEKTGAASSR